MNLARIFFCFIFLTLITKNISITISEILEQTEVTKEEKQILENHE